MRWWKWLGVAGVAGVTATGVVVARAERRRRAYTPDEIRGLLHARLRDADTEGAAGTDAQAGTGTPARRD